MFPLSSVRAQPIQKLSHGRQDQRPLAPIPTLRRIGGVRHTVEPNHEEHADAPVGRAFGAQRYWSKLWQTLRVVHPVAAGSGRAGTGRSAPGTASGADQDWPGGERVDQ